MTSELLSGLLAANLAASLAIVLVLALRGPVRRRFGAAMAYRLWLAPLAAAVAVFVPAPKGLLPAPGLPVAQASQEMMLIFNSGPPASAITALSPAAHAKLSLPPLPLLLLAAWASGALVVLSLTVLAHRRAMRSFGALKGLEGEGALRAARHGLGPALVGVLRPRLVLPADFERRFSEREQALILAHERHHRQCGDPRINGLIALLTCLNWFNPLVHIAAHWLRVDQELSCDAAVVARFPGERRTYAEALLKSQQACIPMPLGCTWPGRSTKLLQERLTMIAYDKPTRPRLLAGSALVGTLCLGVGAAAWAASAATARPAPRPGTAPASADASANAPQAVAAPAAPAAEPAPAPETVAPTVVSMACFSNRCGDIRPRDAVAVEAAIKAGDPKAVMAVGGTASDLLSAMIASGKLQPLPDGLNIADVAKIDTAKFVVNSSGSLSVGFDTQSGGTLRITTPDLVDIDIPPGSPSAQELDDQRQVLVNQQRGFPPGTVQVTTPAETLPNGGTFYSFAGWRFPDGTIIPNPSVTPPSQYRLPDGTMVPNLSARPAGL